jgi:hypothetical protein
LLIQTEVAGGAVNVIRVLNLSAVTQKGPPMVEIGGFKITYPLSTGRLRRIGHPVAAN